MIWKTLILVSILFSANCFAIDLKTSFNLGQAVRDTEYKRPFDTNLKAEDLIKAMGFGWNLGNTLDAHNGNYNEGLNSETSWGNPKTTEAMIDKLVKKGFKTIRIPVTWHNHLIDNNYTIDPNWMKRVKEVVTWCLARGLFVILNVHHDQADYGVSYGKGYYPRTNQMYESERFLLNIWSQIVLAFNDGYEQHLIFEALNEPRLKGDSQEWWYQPGNQNCEEAIKVINEYNELIHTVIRNSGGNNKNRFIMYTSGAAAYTYVTANSFTLPNDFASNQNTKRILVSVHMYTPYDFAMNPDMGKNQFNWNYQNELETNLQTLYNKFVSRGYHVVIGEMGSVDKKNDNERIRWGQFFVTKAKQLKMACVIWDNNIYNTDWNPEEKFGLFHRAEGYFTPDNYVTALIQAAK